MHLSGERRPGDVFALVAGALRAQAATVIKLSKDNIPIKT
jgi:hypothetical protein